jgi:hypothetical protein
MADSSGVRCETETYRNGAVTADIVQQGTGNAARDINNGMSLHSASASDS